MPVQINQGWIDHSAERSRTIYYVGDFQGSAIPDCPWEWTTEINTAADLIHDAMAVLSLMNFTDQTATVIIQQDTPTVPGSENAQREQALWVQYVDTVNQEYGTMTIPGVDRNLVAQINTDEVDIQSNAAAIAFITVFETAAVSRDGNPIEVTRMRLIGRAS